MKIQAPTTPCTSVRDVDSSSAAEASEGVGTTTAAMRPGLPYSAADQPQLLVQQIVACGRLLQKPTNCAAVGGGLLGFLVADSFLADCVKPALEHSSPTARKTTLVFDPSAAIWPNPAGPVLFGVVAGLVAQPPALALLWIDLASVFADKRPLVLLEEVRMSQSLWSSCNNASPKTALYMKAMTVPICLVGASLGACGAVLATRALLSTQGRLRGTAQRAKK